MPKFPADLARAVTNKWPNLVGGEEYIVPEIPSPKLLNAIFECSYLTAATQEEGRYPHFNLVVVRKGTDIRSVGAVPFKFEQSRPMDVSELRRLAPASDLGKSAVWVEFDENCAVIAGLADLGTSWSRARLGFAYNYRVPHCLIIQIDRPGRMKVYQGQFHIATLSDGDLVINGGLDLHVFLHETVNRGLESLAEHFEPPKIESPRDFEDFWFIAHWNIFASIANSISLSGHGGTLIIVDPQDSEVMSCLRIKYSGQFDALRNAFIEFINARNKTADFYEAAELEGKQVSKRVFEAESTLFTATDQLVEATRFIARLASCDGAIVVSPDFRLLGFGAEIRAEMKDDITVKNVINEMGREYASCDVEQFGMRRRSAVKLASRQERFVVLTVSQDGPISAIWREKQDVFVKRGVSLANMNMPWTGGP